MNNRILVLFLWINACSLFSQNIILNSDFEEVNICLEYNEACSPKAWRPTSLKQFGYSENKETGRYISLLLFNAAKENDRKFAQTELVYPLEKGKRYRIRFLIKPDQFKIAAIGMAFSDTMLLSREVDLDQLPDHKMQIPLPVGDLTENKWIKVEQDFVASGNEKFMILGNVLDDTRTIVHPIDQKRYKKYLKSYNPKKRVTYGIDDFELIALDALYNLTETELEKQRIYADSARHTLLRILPSSPEVDAIVPAPRDTSTMLQKPAEKPNLPEKIVISDLLFESSKSELLKEEQASLDEIVDRLRQDLSVNIKVVGHTDSEGTELDNLTLSQERANSVKQYLVVKGIEAHRITASGQGEAFPIMDNSTEEGRQMNRRVEIEFWQ